MRVEIKTVARAIGSRLAARSRRTLRGIDSLRRGGYHAAMTREQTPESRQGQRRHSPAGDGPSAVSSDDSNHSAPDAQVTSNGDQPASAGRSRRVPSARVPNTEAPTLVYTPAGLQQMVNVLRERSLVALDTESNSFYAYYTRVCLIQVTTFADIEDPSPGRVTDYLVDTVRLKSLDPLGELLADTNGFDGGREIVMHAAENDILLLQRDYGFRFPRVFDTQLAARILGWERVGLGALLEECFGVISDKRMQRTDWSHRPLSAQQITYAQMDTHYLPALRVLLLDELREADRLEEAEDGFAELTRLDTAIREPGDRSVWSMKGSHQIELAHTGVLEALWEWREREAQRTDRPPFKIAGDTVLLALAEQRPADRDALYEIPGLSSQSVDRYGTALLGALRDGEGRPLPPLPPRQIRPELLLSPTDQARFERLRRWRTETAQARGVAPEIIFSNDMLLEIVQRSPRDEAALRQIPGIGAWKARTYGPKVLALLEGRSQAGARPA